MRKWLPVMVAALTAAVAVPTLAEGARHQKCSFDLTFLTAPVEATGNPPLNGTETRAAIVDGKLCNEQFRGAARLVILYTTPGKGTIRFTAFGPLGSFEGNAEVTGVPQPDGSTSLSGTGRITGGTGLYKGATGPLSSTGTRPANSHINVVHDTGTIRF
jgi:hypothetical protein